MPDAFRVTDVSPPVYPKRFVVLQVESEKATHMDITITGNCKPFAGGLSEQSVASKALKLNASDTYYERFYTLHDLRIGKEKVQQFIFKDLFMDVFGCCPIVLKVKGGTFFGEPHT